MLEYGEILLRTILAFLLLLIVARILGKQTISNMTFHDFVTAITMGAIAANLAFNDKIRMLYLICSLLVLTAISYAASFISLKSRKARRWLAGAPTVVIDKGRVMDTNMKKLNYTLDSLNESLRQKDVFDIDEVEYAILETNGKLSVKKKIPASGQKSTYFPLELIMDGNVQKKNLQDHGLTEEWLDGELRKKNKKVSEVFYAVRNTKGKVYCDFYDDGRIEPIDLE